MNNLTSHTLSEREFVWQINSPFSSKENTAPRPKKTVKEPVLIKELVAKSFQRLSMQLLERMTKMETELSHLQKENQQLQERLTVLQEAA